MHSSWIITNKIWVLVCGTCSSLRIDMVHVLVKRSAWLSYKSVTGWKRCKLHLQYKEATFCWVGWGLRQFQSVDTYQKRCNFLFFWYVFRRCIRLYIRDVPLRTVRTLCLMKRLGNFPKKQLLVAARNPNLEWLIVSLRLIKLYMVTRVGAMSRLAACRRQHVGSA